METSISLETTNHMILLINSMLYKLDEKIQKLRELRTEAYAFIRRFRPYLSVKFPEISPVGIITKENFFQKPLELITYDKVVSLTEEERLRFLNMVNSDLAEKKQFLICENICLHEAERTYKELNLCQKLCESLYEAHAIMGAVLQNMDDQELHQCRVLYAPGMGDHGGLVSAKIEHTIILAMEIKVLLDEVIFSPLHLVPMGQISKYNSIQLYKKLETLLDKRRELRRAALIDIKEPQIVIEDPFEVDPLFKEVCYVED